MRRLIPTVCVLVSALNLAPLSAGDAPPILMAEIPSLERTFQRLDSSAWGAVWNDPALAAVRTQVDAAMANVTAELGVDAKLLIKEIKNIRLRIDNVAKLENGKIDLRASGQFQASAAATMVMWDKIQTLLKSTYQNSAAKVVAGADAASAFTSTALEQPDVTVAKFKDAIVVGAGPIAPKVEAATTELADATVVVDYRRWSETAIAMGNRIDPVKREKEKALLAELIKRVPELLPTIRFTSTVIPEGFKDRVVQSTVMKGPAVVDRAILGRLPANTLMAFAMAVDGDAAWTAYGEHIKAISGITSSLDDGASPNFDEVIGEGDKLLAQMGIPLTAVEFISGIKGTFLFAVTPGPLPSVTVAIPRSAGIDQLITVLAKQNNIEIPAEGAVGLIPLPEGVMLPALSLINTKQHWVLTSDQLLAADWAEGKAGGFLTAKPAVAALARMPANTSVIGISDTPNVVKTLSQFAGLIPLPDPKLRQALLQGLAKLGAKAGYGSLWSAQVKGTTVAESQGLIGMASLPMIAGFSAAFFASSTPKQRAELNAATFLKAGILPGIIQFMNGGYIDSDIDGRGEVGTIGQLAGDPIPGVNRALSFIGPEFKGQDPIVSGYHFRIYIPTAKADGSSDAAVALAAAKKTAAVADLQEQFWVTYAWPANATGGEPMYAMLPSGVLYQAPYAGTIPAWNSALGTRGWGVEIDAASGWAPMRR